MTFRLASAFLVAILAIAAPSFADDAGKKAFVDAKCGRCQTIASADITASVKSEKMKGPDLDKIGAQRDAEWITKFVEREIQLDEKNHKSAWKGSDEELETISKWLASLK